MKRKISLLLAIVFIIALSGCSVFSGGCNYQEEMYSGDDSISTPRPAVLPEADTALLGVTLTAKDITPGGMTIVCTQSGGTATGELSTGSYYHLERLADGKWTPLSYAYDGSQGELAWTSEAWIINMNGITEWTVDWERLYGTLQPGTYRIAKQIMDWHGVGNYDLYYSYAQFVIE